MSIEPASAVLIVLLGSMALLVTDALRYDVIAVLVVLALIASGATSAEEAFASFGAPAVVVLASMYVFAQAFVRWGVAESIGRGLLTRTARPERLPFRVALIAGALSTVVSDAAVTATLMPVVHAAARRSSVPASRLLIPLSFGSLLGGTVTVVGTSSNVALNDVLVQLGEAPFGLFEYTPVGAIVLLVGALYFLGPGRWLLPDTRAGETLNEHYRVPRYVTEVLVEPGSELAARSVGDLELLARREIALLGIVRAEGEPDVLAPGPQNRIRSGDVLILQGEPEAILDLREELGLRQVDQVRRGAARLASTDTLLVESVVPVGSQLVGRTLGETDYRAKTNLNVLAVSQHGQVVPARVGNLRLGVGDTLLIHGHARDIERVRRQRELLVLAERPVASSGPGAWIVVLTLAAVLAAAALGWPLAACALSGALALVLLRCLQPAEALAAIDWSVILLTGGLLALGRAFDEHGLGAAAASALLSLEGLQGSHHALLAAVILATSLLTQLTTNVSAVVVMTPVALALAEQAAADPRPFAVGVALSASFAFMSPVGHAANTMVAGPGDYRFVHFLRVGSPLMLLETSLLLVAIPLLWPF